ncbi:MAG: hypothetical protein ABIO76_05890 [Ginsengibacter sp.]
MLLVIWLIAVQDCYKWRTEDKAAIENFKKAGVVLTAHTERINGKNCITFLQEQLPGF